MVVSAALSNEVYVFGSVGEHLQKFVNPGHAAVYSTLLADLEAVQTELH